MQAQPEPDTGSAEELPGGVLQSILEQTNPRTLVNSRPTAPFIRDIASNLITALQAQNGELPDRAWKIYPNAKVLHVINGNGTSMEETLEFLYNLAHTLQAAPAYVEELYIHNPSYAVLLNPLVWMSDSDIDATCVIAAALSSSQCYTAIKRLHLERPIQLIQDIPKTSNTFIRLLTNGMQQLRDLQLPWATCSASTWKALSQLPKLESLKLGTLVIGPGPSSPSLAHLHVLRLLTLRPQGDDDVVMDADSLLGFVTTQLPQLQELIAASRDTDALIHALDKHQHLSKFECYESSDDVRLWNSPGTLSTLPELQHVLISNYSNETLVDLLADLADCSKLSTLEFHPYVPSVGDDITPEDLALLASGAARCSLQTISLSMPEVILDSDHELGGGLGYDYRRNGYDVETVAQLLKGDMVMLRELEVMLALPDEIDDEAQLQAVLPSLLEQHGATVRCSVVVSEFDEQGRYAECELRVG